MGTDKAALQLAGRSLVAHVVERLAPQCAEVALNGPPDAASLAATGCAVFADIVEGGLGPLAGIVTGLRHAGGARPAFTHVLTVPVDVPFLPNDLVRRLAAALGAADVAVAASGGQRHFTVALWRTKLAGDVEHALVEEGRRRVEDVVERAAHAVVAWPATPFDPFANINTPADLERAAARVRTV